MSGNIWQVLGSAIGLGIVVGLYKLFEWLLSQRKKAKAEAVNEFDRMPTTGVHDLSGFPVSVSECGAAREACRSELKRDFERGSERFKDMERQLGMLREEVRVGFAEVKGTIKGAVDDGFKDHVKDYHK